MSSVRLEIISAAWSILIWRELGAKMNPRASAPAARLACASLKVVVAQIFTQIIGLSFRVVPSLRDSPGFPAYPALKRWAKVFRPLRGLVFWLFRCVGVPEQYLQCLTWCCCAH